MARMRTIKQTVLHIKLTDPDTAVTEWWLRSMLKTDKLKHHMAGNKYLIDIDYLEEYLKNPPEEEKQEVEYGILRKVNG